MPSASEIPQRTGILFASRLAFTETKLEPAIPSDTKREWVEESTFIDIGLTPSALLVTRTVGMRLPSRGALIVMP